MAADPDPPVEPRPTGRGADPAPAAAPAPAADTDRSFTTHPTGQALAKDLREVRSKPERAFNIGAVLGLTLAVATFIFLIQNNGPTDFEWLWFDFELPLWTALVGALVIGAVLVLSALAVHRRRRKRISRRESAAGRLEEALVGGEAGATGRPAPGAPPAVDPDVPAPPSEPASPPASSPPAAADPRPPSSGPPSSGPPSSGPPSADPRPAPPASPDARSDIAPPTGPRQVRGPMQG